MHILTHNLNHKCDVCGKAFSRPWLLQGHMRSRTGDKPYGCAHCGKSFADRSNLRAHMQTHSAFKNFNCKRCNKSFALSPISTNTTSRPVSKTSPFHPSKLRQALRLRLISPSRAAVGRSPLTPSPWATLLQVTPSPPPPPLRTPTGLQARAPATLHLRPPPNTSSIFQLQYSLTPLTLSKFE